MKEKLIRFMQGRYGVDTLSKCMVWVALAAMLVSMLLGENRLAPMFSILSFAALIYCAKRQQAVCGKPGVFGEDGRAARGVCQADERVKAA